MNANGNSDAFTLADPPPPHKPWHGEPDRAMPAGRLAKRQRIAIGYLSASTEAMVWKNRWGHSRLCGPLVLATCVIVGRVLGSTGEHIRKTGRVPECADRTTSLRTAVAHPEREVVLENALGLLGFDGVRHKLLQNL